MSPRVLENSEVFAIYLDVSPGKIAIVPWRFSRPSGFVDGLAAGGLALQMG